MWRRPIISFDGAGRGLAVEIFNHRVLQANVLQWCRINQQGQFEFEPSPGVEQAGGIACEYRNSSGLELAASMRREFDHRCGAAFGLEFYIHRGQLVILDANCITP